MQEYHILVDTLVDIAKVTRPALSNGTKPITLHPAEQKRLNNIQHGLCDLLEDAAVAIDDLLGRLKLVEEESRRKHPEFA